MRMPRMENAVRRRMSGRPGTRSCGPRPNFTKDPTRRLPELRSARRHAQNRAACRQHSCRTAAPDLRALEGAKAVRILDSDNIWGRIGGVLYGARSTRGRTAPGPTANRGGSAGALKARRHNCLDDHIECYNAGGLRRAAAGLDVPARHTGAGRPRRNPCRRGIRAASEQTRLCGYRGLMSTFTF